MSPTGLKMVEADEQRRIQNMFVGIAEFDDDFPDHAQCFEAKRRDYADLGRRVSALARSLRVHAGMPREYPKPRAWSRDPEFREVIERVDNARDAYVHRLAENAAKYPDVGSYPRT